MTVVTTGMLVHPSLPTFLAHGTVYSKSSIQPHTISRTEHPGARLTWPLPPPAPGGNPAVSIDCILSTCPWAALPFRQDAKRQESASVLSWLGSLGSATSQMPPQSSNPLS